MSKGGRLLVLGDIHGAHRALVQVLDRANVDRERDHVVFLGDVADGWPETRECVDELLTLKWLTFILGNHDDWFRQWVRVGWNQPIWRDQGGWATLASYGGDPRDVPDSHRNLLESAKHWHQEGRRIFLHAGWPLLDRHPMSCGPDTLMWDRTLWKEARRRHMYALPADAEPLTDWEVYVGHTSTEKHSLEPVCFAGVWNLDQGAGWGGKLTLMDADTGEFWQSDRTPELYPEHAGRYAA